MADATFTFRVEDDLKAAFAEAARQDDQTGAQLLRRYMRKYVDEARQRADYDSWFREQVRIGIESGQAGKVSPDDEVEARFATRREASLRKLAS